MTVLEVPDPRAPRTGEVLIEVEAAGVGSWDEFARTGRWDLGRGPPMPSRGSAGMAAGSGDLARDQCGLDVHCLGEDSKSRITSKRH